MKKNYLFIITTVLSLSFFNLKINNVFAQVPQGLNYQAIARDALGNLIINKNINVRISIISGSA